MRATPGSRRRTDPSENSRSDSQRATTSRVRFFSQVELARSKALARLEAEALRTAQTFLERLPHQLCGRRHLAKRQSCSIARLSFDPERYADRATLAIGLEGYDLANALGVGNRFSARSGRIPVRFTCRLRLVVAYTAAFGSNFGQVRNLRNGVGRARAGE